MGSFGRRQSAWWHIRLPRQSMHWRRFLIQRSPRCQAIQSVVAWSWRSRATCESRRMTSSLAMPPAKLGLVYSHTGLRRFLDAVGATRTRELFLLGNYIDASTALQWALVNRVHDPTDLETAALEMASELAANAPLSQKGNKCVIAALLDGQRCLPAEVETELIELRRASFDSEDLREGMSAFAEKRAPRWRGE